MFIPCRGLVALFLEGAGNAGQGLTVEVEGVDVADGDGLGLVDDEVAVGAFVVAEEPSVRDGDFPIREPFPVPPRDVFGDGAGFFLREAGHDGDQQFTFGVEGSDVLLFEEHLHPGVLQRAHGGQGVDGVAGEPGHALGDDQINLPGQGIGNHVLEAGAVFGGSSGDAFVGVNTCQLPPGMVGDVAGVVVDLRLIRGDLVLVIGGDAGVACDFYGSQAGRELGRCSGVW